jgi:uncharacterized membrane protein YidH (DUF202 family)
VSRPTGQDAVIVSELHDSGLAVERTALAWTRSALNMAASGALIARAAFESHLVALGVVSAVGAAVLSILTWHRGRTVYRERRNIGAPPRLQTRAFSLLSAATFLIAMIAVIVTVAI